MKRESPFTIHAKEQALERYGVLFSKKQWRTFGKTLQNPKCTIRLTDDKFACYFAGTWFLLVREGDGTVSTIYRREFATDADKMILMRDERYQRINNDAFCVRQNSPDIIPPLQKTVDMPVDVEVPTEELQSAERFLNRFCDVRGTG